VSFVWPPRNLHLSCPRRESEQVPAPYDHCPRRVSARSDYGSCCIVLGVQLGYTSPRVQDHQLARHLHKALRPARTSAFAQAGHSFPARDTTEQPDPCRGDLRHPQPCPHNDDCPRGRRGLDTGRACPARDTEGPLQTFTNGNSNWTNPVGWCGSGKRRFATCPTGSIVVASPGMSRR
jgi:hypothetical protein